jgi:hypothetical protein
VTRSTHVYAAKKFSLCGWCSWMRGHESVLIVAVIAVVVLR